MKLKLKVLATEYNDEKFRQAIDELESIGWKVDREYGGKMPNYRGHGAELSKQF